MYISVRRQLTATSFTPGVEAVYAQEAAHKTRSHVLCFVRPDGYSLEARPCYIAFGCVTCHVKWSSFNDKVYKPGESVELHERDNTETRYHLEENSVRSPKEAD